MRNLIFIAVFVISSAMEPEIAFSQLRKTRNYSEAAEIIDKFTPEQYERVFELYRNGGIENLPVWVHNKFAWDARPIDDPLLRFGILKMVRVSVGRELRQSDWNGFFDLVLDGVRNELETHSSERPFYEFCMSLSIRENSDFMQKLLAVALAGHDGDLFTYLLRKGSNSGITMDKLPTKLVNKETAFLSSLAPACSICLDEMNDRDETVACCSNGHVYHRTCLRTSLVRRRNCPECRETCPPTLDLMKYLYWERRESMDIERRFDFYLEFVLENARRGEPDAVEMLTGIMEVFVSSSNIDKVELILPYVEQDSIGKWFTLMIQNSILMRKRGLDNSEEFATRVVSLFVGAGVDVNYNFGIALLAAVYHGHNFLVALLEENGASVADSYYDNKICDSPSTREFILSRTGRVVKECVIRWDGVPRLFNDMMF
jgi:hypothetical protein